MKRIVSAALMAAFFVLAACSDITAPAERRHDSTTAVAYDHGEDPPAYCPPGSGYQGSDGRLHQCPGGN